MRTQPLKTRVGPRKQQRIASFRRENVVRNSRRAQIRAAQSQASTNDREASATATVERAINEVLVNSVVFLLDKFYKDLPYQRFYVLETIARVPYFSYICVLHLYETLGWWRRSDYIRVHFAETWNELHHLLIMEALGGDKRWIDRFLAQHVAVAYFWVTCGMYLFSPRMAYNFAEKVESHAFKTYDEFLKSHADELKREPAPRIAVEYYAGQDLFLFDEFQTSVEPNTRRPVIENLYDVFVNIRSDEAEHCKTMIACQSNRSIVSPHSTQPSYFSVDEEE